MVVPLELGLSVGRGKGVDWEMAAEESPCGCEGSESLVEDARILEGCESS